MSMIGKSLAHYQITDLIGKGGMGEVYRAKDQKLGRDVAIKVLPEEFARDTDRVARFQREAKLLASLNHPNIAAIHGLEEADGTHFLVLELIEGETIADRIQAGPIPAEEALKLALQLAEALEAAHDRGVIHRDLKPANIKITRDGKVKVLDFGLAKAFSGDPENVNLSNSPTLSDAATQQGVILGTAAYMSPEQARGKTVDKRADIWAFGVVLFEMLTGRQVFSGETVSDTLASVLAREPKWNSLPPNLHPRIRFLLERCLKKDPRNRYSGISDARVEIQEVQADPSGVFMPPAGTETYGRKPQRAIFWIAAAVIVTAVIVGAVVWSLRKTEPREVTRFYYELPQDQQFNAPTTPVLAVSPDGKQFAYSTIDGLYLRSIGEMEARFVAGTGGEDIRMPMYSPDGKWIVYYSGKDKKIKKIATAGGAPQALCDVVDFATLGSTNDGFVFFSAVSLQGGGFNGEIRRVSINGGAPESILKTEGGIIASPQLLPDGKSFLFTKAEITANPITTQIMVQSPEMKEPKGLMAGYQAWYVPTGHIVYTIGSNPLEMGGHNLFAVPFDTDSLEITGGAVPLIENIRGPFGAHYAVSASGTLAYLPGAAGELTTGRTLVWVDKEGKETSISAPPNLYVYPQISPDGSRIALGISPDNVTTDVWIWDFHRETLTRLTFQGAGIPIWTPDGKRIVYRATRDGVDGLYWRMADGTGKEEKLYSNPDRIIFPLSFSRDGKYLAVSVIEGPATLQNSKWDIGLLTMDGEPELKPLLHDEFVEVMAQISPDSRWIAYASNESSGETQKAQVYVRPFPDVEEGKWQVSTSGGSCPRWSPDSRELYYLTDDNDLMSVQVEAKPALSLGTPLKLFKSVYIGLGTEGTPWDVNPKDGRFLMMKGPGSAAGREQGAAPNRINIVLNWFEELKQKVPEN